MNKQSQSAGDGTEAYQSGRDIVINNGMTSDQMADVMIAIAGKLQKYIEEANTKAEERYIELREAVIKEFGRENTSARASAFSEPDYQAIVQEAHQSFARSGDADLKLELVRLLGERSSMPTGSRKAFILNEAIRTAGSLTSQEYSALATLFLITCVKINGSPDLILDKLTSIIKILLEDIPHDNDSYEYLESMRCISVNNIRISPLWDLLHQAYAADFSLGFTFESVQEIVKDVEGIKKLSKIMKGAPANFGKNVTFHIESGENIKEKIESLGMQKEIVQKLTRLYEDGLPDVNSIRVELSKTGIIPMLEKKWQETSIKSASLTALGKALGHSALVSKVDFDAPLEIWIK